jgi:hypothetical protein
MTNPSNFIRNSMLAGLSLLLIGATKQGCQSTQPPQPPPTQKISALKPSLTPLPETKPSQDKGGVEISVAPVVYTVVDGTKATDRILYERVKRDYEIGTGRVFETPVRVIERTTTPVPKIQPDRLKFQVKVVNKMPRVFRGQGMVVQFNVAGKLHNVSPSGYAELVQMIVPPRNEFAVDIYGPPLSELPANCPVGIFLYDVVTKTDDAGNVTEKQNFEWYWNYTTQLEEREGTITKERLEQKIGQTVRVK